ncbi:MAG: NAD-dependent protein deacylase [Aquirhabdus sp.]
MNQPRVVVLTGAGISAESGIKTFRASDGLWEDHRIEDVASPEGFRRNPELVQHFYNMRRAQILEPQIQPNAAHLALTELESALGDNFLLVTQNVDDLHERAGSKRLLHMHGELLKARCLCTGKVYPFDGEINAETVCACCQKTGTLRPHIVWFGEIPLYMDEIEHEISQCDIFLSIGTSGAVYPAAGFVQLASYAGAKTIEINLEAAANQSAFDTHIYGKAVQMVPEWVQAFLSQ